MNTEAVAGLPGVESAADARPWYSQITRTQWNVYWATFLGWTIDAFDFNILTFVLIDIQKSFTIDRALAGALGTVTLATRLVGATLAGTMADRYGRKLPLMLSIVWFSLFACMSGFSTSYAMLFGLRALFGIGMGGEYAAGMPLVLEHWPTRYRGLISGMLHSGWYWGYVIAAVVFQFIYPMFSAHPELAWRAMFWIAVVPALITLWIRRHVPESPVWLERQNELRAASGRVPRQHGISFFQLFRPDLLMTTLQTSLLVATFICSYHSIAFWYPTLMREAGRSPFPYLVLFNIGAIAGSLSWGRFSEGRFGRRGAVTVAMVLALAMIPPYLFSAGQMVLGLGATGMGFFGAGAWGVVPAYLNERFPTSVRGVGPGFAYHAGAALGSLTPVVLGIMQDRGTALPRAMAIGICASIILAVTCIWLGPETRGRRFSSAD